MPVYCSCTFWIPSSSWKGPMKLCLFIFPSYLSVGLFSWNWIMIQFQENNPTDSRMERWTDFSEFCDGTRKLYQLVCARFFWKTFFAPPPPPQKKKKRNGPKVGVFFNLKKKLVINFPWICSILKIYIICRVPVQIF